jgi:hypothetical protein
MLEMKRFPDLTIGADGAAVYSAVGGDECRAREEIVAGNLIAASACVASAATTCG